MGTLTRRPYAPRSVVRSIPSALKFFGIDEYQPNYHVGGKHYAGYHGFWARHEDDLPLLVYDVRIAIRKRIREVRTDLTENHEQAVQVVEVYEWLKKQFAKRGVRL